MGLLKFSESKLEVGNMCGKNEDFLRECVNNILIWFLLKMLYTTTKLNLFHILRNLQR